MPQDLITSKERFRVKSRKFKLLNENGNVKLGQEVKIKENMQVLPVLFYEDFYKFSKTDKYVRPYFLLKS